MKNVLKIALVLAVAFAALGASSAVAAPVQDGQVSDAMLAGMGLSGMERLSDEQGMAVRGKGPILVGNFAVVVAKGDVKVKQSFKIEINKNCCRKVCNGPT
jgi:hypothetical protein